MTSLARPTFPLGAARQLAKQYGRGGQYTASAAVNGPALRTQTGGGVGHYSTATSSPAKPLSLYTWRTPNGRKVSIFLEELKAQYGLAYDPAKSAPGGHLDGRTEGALVHAPEPKRAHPRARRPQPPRPQRRARGVRVGRDPAVPRAALRHAAQVRRGRAGGPGELQRGAAVDLLHGASRRIRCLGPASVGVLAKEKLMMLTGCLAGSHHIHAARRHRAYAGTRYAPPAALRGEAFWRPRCRCILTGSSAHAIVAGHFVRAAPEDIPYAKKRYIDETKRLYGVLDARLAGREWLAGRDGGTYSIADMNAFPWVSVHGFVEIETLDEWPNVKAWVERAMERPAVQAGMQVP